MSRKTDLEMIPEVIELMGLMRETRVREGKLMVKDLSSYVESIKKMIPVYQELKGREYFKIAERYVGIKLQMVTEILKNNYGIDIKEE